MAWTVDNQCHFNKTWIYSGHNNYTTPENYITLPLGLLALTCAIIGFLFNTTILIVIIKSTYLTSFSSSPVNRKFGPGVNRNSSRVGPINKLILNIVLTDIFFSLNLFTVAAHLIFRSPKHFSSKVANSWVERRGNKSDFIDPNEYGSVHFNCLSDAFHAFCYYVCQFASIQSILFIGVVRLMSISTLPQNTSKGFKNISKRVSQNLKRVSMRFAGDRSHLELSKNVTNNATNATDSRKSSRSSLKNGLKNLTKSILIKPNFQRIFSMISVSLAWIFPIIMLLPLISEDGFDFDHQSDNRGLVFLPTEFFCSFSMAKQMHIDYSISVRIIFQLVPLILVAIFYVTIFLMTWATLEKSDEKLMKYKISTMNVNAMNNCSTRGGVTEDANSKKNLTSSDLNQLRTDFNLPFDRLKQKRHSTDGILHQSQKSVMISTMIRNNSYGNSSSTIKKPELSNTGTDQNQNLSVTSVDNKKNTKLLNSDEIEIEISMDKDKNVFSEKTNMEDSIKLTYEKPPRGAIRKLVKSNSASTADDIQKILEFASNISNTPTRRVSSKGNSLEQNRRNSEKRVRKLIRNKTVVGNSRKSSSILNISKVFKKFSLKKQEDLRFSKNSNESKSKNSKSSDHSNVGDLKFGDPVLQHEKYLMRLRRRSSFGLPQLSSYQKRRSSIYLGENGLPDRRRSHSSFIEEHERDGHFKRNLLNFNRNYSDEATDDSLPYESDFDQIISSVGKQFFDETAPDLYKKVRPTKIGNAMGRSLRNFEMIRFDFPSMSTVNPSNRPSEQERLGKRENFEKVRHSTDDLLSSDNQTNPNNETRTRAWTDSSNQGTAKQKKSFRNRAGSILQGLKLNKSDKSQSSVSIQKLIKSSRTPLFINNHEEEENFTLTGKQTKNHQIESDFEYRRSSVPWKGGPPSLSKNNSTIIDDSNTWRMSKLIPRNSNARNSNLETLRESVLEYESSEASKNSIEIDVISRNSSNLSKQTNNFKETKDQMPSLPSVDFKNLKKDNLQNRHSVTYTFNRNFELSINEFPHRPKISTIEASDRMPRVSSLAREESFSFPTESKKTKTDPTLLKFKNIKFRDSSDFVSQPSKFTQNDDFEEPGEMNKTTNFLTVTDKSQGNPRSSKRLSGISEISFKSLKSNRSALSDLGQKISQKIKLVSNPISRNALKKNASEIVTISSSRRSRDRHDVERNISQNGSHFSGFSHKYNQYFKSKFSRLNYNFSSTFNTDKLKFDASSNLRDLNHYLTNNQLFSHLYPGGRYARKSQVCRAAHIEQMIRHKKMRRRQKIQLLKRSILLALSLILFVLPGFLAGLLSYKGHLAGGALVVGEAFYWITPVINPFLHIYTNRAIMKQHKNFFRSTVRKLRNRYFASY